jgi:hypothetical protein
VLVLYLATKAVDDNGLAAAYREAYGALQTLEGVSLTMSDIKLVSATNPIAQDAMMVRDRQGGKVPIRFRDGRFGNLSIEEAYIYPRASGTMTTRDVLQFLFSMATLPTGSTVPISVITLRNGLSIRGIVSGFNLGLPSGFAIRLRDPNTGLEQTISGADVANIQ